MYTKRIPMIILLVLLFGAQASSQWLPQETPSLPEQYMIYSMKAVNKDVVWALADTTHALGPAVGFPRVLRTTDGGTTWTAIRVPETDGLFFMDVFALDEFTAWITSNCMCQSSDNLGGILHTTDGGETWTEQLHNIQTLFIHFFTGLVGVEVNSWSVKVTDDGGQTWESIPVENRPQYKSGEMNILMSSSNAMAAVGDTIWVPTSMGRVHRSTDRGHHWDVVSIPSMESRIITSLAFRDGLHGLAISCLDNVAGLAATTVARTTDGGVNWEIVQPAISQVSGTCLAYVPGTASTFVMVGDYLPGTAYTTDDGASWSYLDMDKYHTGVSFVDPMTGWTSCISYPSYKNNYIQTWHSGLLDIDPGSATNMTDVSLLGGCYPHPVVSQTSIPYRLQRSGWVHLTIYDLLGRRVRTLIDQNMNPGRYTTQFDGTGLPAGRYVLLLDAAGEVHTRMVTLQR
ncbi:hypothetical protein KQI65_15875 [bacterium]|nr:hypothetical protein [bacterium]